MSPKTFQSICNQERVPVYLVYVVLARSCIEPEVILRNVLGGGHADVMVVQHMMADLGLLDHRAESGMTLCSIQR